MLSTLRPGSGLSTPDRSAPRVLSAGVAFALFLCGVLTLMSSAAASARANPNPASEPGLTIDTSGPAAATAGELITYNLAVTNTGGTVFDDGKLVVTDDRCQAPPALLSRNGDASPVTLSPGESWTYSCQAATFPGQRQIDNSGSVTGTDQGGRQATATDVAGTALAQPARAALPGGARLRGAVGCTAAAYFLATVSGKRIASVTYHVDGKRVRTLTKAARGVYSMRLRVRALAYGGHEVTARVAYVTGARTKETTLGLRFARCRPRAVRPQFTG